MKSLETQKFMKISNTEYLNYSGEYGIKFIANTMGVSQLISALRTERQPLKTNR